MGKIGNWGKDLVFEVNSETQLPFSDMKREVKAKWAAHNIRGEKPRAEYICCEQTKVSLKVTFSARRGQRPYHSVHRMQESCRRGYLNYLFIGGKRIGSGKYYIESVSTSWDEVWNKGELVQATSTITFRETDG